MRFRLVCQGSQNPLLFPYRLPYQIPIVRDILSDMLTDLDGRGVDTLEIEQGRSLLLKSSSHQD